MVVRSGNGGGSADAPMEITILTPLSQRSSFVLALLSSPQMYFRYCSISLDGVSNHGWISELSGIASLSHSCTTGRDVTIKYYNPGCRTGSVI